MHLTLYARMMPINVTKEHAHYDKWRLKVMAGEFKLFSMMHALATELLLRTLYPACGRLRSFFDDHVRDRTYQWGGEYWRLKFTESLSQLLGTIHRQISHWCFGVVTQTWLWEGRGPWLTNMNKSFCPSWLRAENSPSSECWWVMGWLLSMLAVYKALKLL